MENTTATRLLNTEGYTPVKILDGPKNLDFENGEVWNPPLNWLVPSELSSFNFQAVLPEELAAINFQYLTCTDNPYDGKQCVSISKLPDQAYGETYGWIRQVIDATQYRNKKIKLSAAVRIEPNETNDKAYLWLRVIKPGYGSQGWVFFDKMADRPIMSSEWNRYEITGEVTEDAISIEYGFAFVGDGKAYIDGVSLNIVEK